MGASRPRVILSAAVSVDGKIASVGGDSDLSSPEDRRRVHLLRSRADAILVGRNTLEIDDPLLTARVDGGRNPLRVILDPRGSISAESRILRTSGQVPTILAVTGRAPAAAVERLACTHAEVMVCGSVEIDLGELLSRLYDRGVRLLLVEGGGIVNWHFVSGGLVDEVIVTVSPCLVGGDAAASLVRGAGFPSVAESARLSLRRVSRSGDEVTLEYAVRGSGPAGDPS